MRGYSRCVAALLTCLLAQAALAQIVERAIPGDPVATDAGRVAGLTLASGVRAYLGIPYAAPPVRELRWRAPQPVTPWRGTYHADRKAPECIQVLRAHTINHYFGEEATSEDCLYLNLWLPPTARPGAHLPVIVFLYGGGNTIGSSGMALYAGEQVARAGAVFVNFNYRLGALGFLAHPELSAESPAHVSGNYAHLDQIAALAWVQRNIARFGGDPDQVIVSGQSAGALSVSLLQLSPLAHGLFRGVAAFSGSALGLGELKPLKEAEATGLAVASALKVSSLAELRALPADRILAVQQDCQLGCSGSVAVGGANVDGVFLPAAPAELYARHAYNDVPVIAGYTLDEFPGPLHAAETLAAYQGAARELYGADAARLLALYPAATDAEAQTQSRAVSRDASVMLQGARRWAVAQTRSGGASVYLYQFAERHPFNPAVEIADHPEAVGVYHTSDVPYWFQTQDALNLFRPTRLWRESDRQLARQMTQRLIDFARTGSPSSPAQPWPAWNAREEPVLVLKAEPQLTHLNAERLDLLGAHTTAPTRAALPRGTRD